MLRNLSYVFAFITMVLVNASPGMCAGSFADDFSSGLSAWVTGTHPGVNDEPDIELHDGFCEFKQDYDYLETRQHFAGDFELVLDVSRQGPTNKDGSIWVQLTTAPELGAIFRFRYKRDNRESINIGRPPHESAEAHSWDTIDDGNYLRDLEDADPPHAGQLTVARENGKLRVMFTDDNGYTLETPFVPLASGDATAIRIWGTKNTGIDNVFIRYADTVDPVVGPAQDAGIAATVVPEGSTVPTSGRVLLAETFSGDLRDWNVGAHPNATAADEPQVLITNGACEFRETYHYLETRVGFYEGFRFSCDVEYDGPPPQQGNLWLQLVNSPGLGGIFRFPYGAGKTESISIGIPPHPSLVMGTWNSVKEGHELKQLTQAEPPHQGRLEFEYVDGQIALAYTDDAGNRVTTPPVDVNHCKTTALRIWGGKNTRIDNVQVVSLSATAPTPHPDESAEPADYSQHSDAEDYLRFAGNTRVLRTGSITTMPDPRGGYLSILHFALEHEEENALLQIRHEEEQFQGSYQYDSALANGSFYLTATLQQSADAPSLQLVLTTGSLVITRSGSRYTVVASGTGVLRDEDGETEEKLELQYIGELQQQETYQ